MKSINVESVIQDIEQGKFVFADEWERDWNTQPKPGTRYFVGTATPGSTYNIQWMPRTGRLSTWSVDDAKTPGVELKLDSATARRLTTLIERKLAEGEAARSSHSQHCSCRHGGC